LRCCAWCGGGFSDGRVEEMLSLRRLLPESLAEKVRRWVRRGPHAVWPGSVGVPGAVMGVCAEASMDLRVRRSGLCSSRTTVPWWSRGGALEVVGACSGLRLGVAQRWRRQRRCQWIVTVFSPFWVWMVVCCVGCVCSCAWVCSCGGVCFDSFCTIAVSSYMT
jgi:hypothetical protein